MVKAHRDRFMVEAKVILFSVSFLYYLDPEGGGGSRILPLQFTLTPYGQNNCIDVFYRYAEWLFEIIKREKVVANFV